MYHIIISLSQRVRKGTCTLQLIRADLARWCVLLQHESPATGCCMKLWWSMFLLLFQAAAARNLRLGQQKKQWNLMKHKKQSKKILLFQICEGLLSTGTGQPTAIWTSTLTPASVVGALNTVGICLDISGQISLRSKQKRKEPEALRVTLAHKLKDSLPKCRPLACGKCMKIKMSGNGKVNRWSRKPRITKTWLAPFKDFPGLHFFCKLLEQLWHPL